MHKLLSICLALSTLIFATDLNQIRTTNSIETTAGSFDIKPPKPIKEERNIRHNSSVIGSDVTEQTPIESKKRVDSESFQINEQRLNEAKQKEQQAHYAKKINYSKALIEKNGGKQPWAGENLISLDPDDQIATTHTRTASDLFFSEYAEGGSNRKYLEIYNGTGADVDMSGYAIGICNNGHSAGDNPDPLYEVLTPMVGTALAGDVFVVSRTNAGDDIIPEMDFDGGIGAGAPCSYNGNDWVGLYKISSDGTETLLDVIGPNPGASTPGYDEFNVAGESAACQNNTIIRKSSVMGGNTDWTSSSGTDADNSEWTVHPQDYFDDLGVHTMVDPDAPYFSEGFEGEWPPAGWTLYTDDATAGWDGSIENWQQGPDLNSWSDYSAGVAHSGSQYAFADDYDNQGGEYSAMISPSMDLSSATEPSLKFFYWDFADYDVVTVDASTDGGATWTNLATTPTGTNGWEEITVGLAAYVGQSSVHLRFGHSSQYGYSNPSIDDITVAEPPTVPVASVSETALDFGTVSTSSSLSKEFTVSNTGGAALTGTVTSDNAKFTLSTASLDVAPGESSTVTVTYSPTEVSDDMATVTIEHNADGSPNTVSLMGSGTDAILFADFDGDFPPTGWSVLNNDEDSYTWRQGNTYLTGVLDGFGAYGSGNQDDYLITPELDLSGGRYQLEWYDVVESSGYPNNYSVYVSVDGGVTWESQADYVCTNTTLDLRVLSLTAFSSTVHIAFHQTFSQASFYGFALENVSVKPAPEEPILSVSVESLQYPATMLGSSSTATVTLSNLGTGDLTGTVTYPAGFTGPASFTNDDTELAVSYSPTAAGMHDGSMVIESTGGSATVALMGNAGGSALSFEGDEFPSGWTTVDNDGQGTPDGLSWGSPPGGAHTGTSGLWGAYNSSGAPNSDWLMSPILDVTTDDAMVTFYSKNYSSSYAESYSVYLSTAADGVFDVVLEDVTLADEYGSGLSGWQYEEIDLSSYVGTQVMVGIEYNATNMFYWILDDLTTPAVYVPSDPLISFYPESLDFGTVPLGETKTLEFYYTNSGAGDLVVSGVSFGGENMAYALHDATVLPITTTSGEDGSFSVTFTPTEASEYMNVMTIVQNGGDDLSISLMGSGIDAVFLEDFSGGIPADWYNNSDRWYGELGYAYHEDDNNPDDVNYEDTLRTSAISLPAVEGHYYELTFQSYQYFGSYNVLGDFAISTDGGLTYTSLFTNDNSSNDWELVGPIDLSAFEGGDVHLAMVYHGDYADEWGVDDILVKKIEVPEYPQLAGAVGTFPATGIGASSSATLSYQNIGAVALTSASVSYPASMTGPATIESVEPGGIGSFEVTYTPTEAGMEDGMIVIDASAEGSELVQVAVEANAGEVAYDMESITPRWRQYSLDGNPFDNNGQLISDRWSRVGGGEGSGLGHSGDIWLNVYSYEDFWGGVDDYLVSPRLDVEEGEVFSFWAQGGYGDGTMFDNLVVYSATEEPIMGYDDDGQMTGFTNMDTWTELYSGQPTDVGWDAHEYVLSAHDNTYLIIHAAPNDPTGWALKIDDLAHPDVFRNPNAVLNTYKTYSLGETGPMGATAEVFVQNSGEADLIIESMEFAHGHDFHVVATGLTFPLTLAAYETADFSVVLDPSELGELEDHLMFTSNYDPSDLDAFGGGTDHTVYKALVVNGEPGPFTLLAPSDGTSIVLEADADLTGQYMNIAWNPSMDPDGEEIHYSFESTLSVEDDQGYVTWEMDLDAPLNALMNGGFEDGMEGWLVFQTGQTNVQVMSETFTEPLEGMHVLSIEPNHADGATYPNYTTVYRGHDLSAMGLLAGQELMVHGVAHPHGFEGSENSAYMFVRFYDANSALVTPPGYTLVSDLIDTEMEMSGGADDGWYPLDMHVVIPEGAMYMDVGVEYATASAGHGGTVLLDEMGVFAPLTANTLTLSYDQALAHAIDDRVHHLSMAWTVYAMDPWSETQATNGPFTLAVDLSAYVDALAVDGGSTLPGKFALHNNYPNPFNPVTNITYDIPEVANVTLEIYNITGQKVRTLAQGSHEPGRYRVLWNATNDHGEGLSSGMYVYRIQAGDFVSTKKLVLMK